MLIDGKLVEASGGRTFENVNPATEEVLGQVADASARGHAAGHRRRPAGLRRDRVVHRPVVPPPLPRAAPPGPGGRAGGDPGAAHPRGRVPPHAHLRPAARRAARRRAHLPGPAHRRVRVGDRPSRRRRLPGKPQLPAHPEGAGRRGRGHRAVELPLRGLGDQAGPGAGHRQHRGAQAGARHPVERHPARPHRRRAHRHPGRASSTSSRRRTTWSARSSPSRRRWTSSPSPGRRRWGDGSWRRVPPR